MRSRTLALGAALVVVGGCGVSWTEGSDDGLRHLSTATTSARAGRIQLKVPVEEGDSSMVVTVDGESTYMSVVRSAVSPSGERVYDVDAEWDSGRYKTGARYSTEIVSLNWPILQGDAPLEPGNWKVEVALVNPDFTYQSGVDTDIDVLLKSDPGFGGGTLKVRIVFAGATQNDAEVRRAVEAAKEIWEDLYAQAGVELDFSEGTYANGALEQPGYGSGADYEAIVADTPVGSMTLVLVPTVVTLPSEPDILGVSGGIPGPLVPTSMSVVTVATQLHAGSNGLFSPGEERLLAETMAHEVGHYVGLFHPVEGTWDAWDAISDTPECDSASECQSALGDNLMFVSPVCSNTGCIPQDALTDLQAAAMRRYVGVH